MMRCQFSLYSTGLIITSEKKSTREDSRTCTVDHGTLVLHKNNSYCSLRHAEAPPLPWVWVASYNFIRDILTITFQVCLGYVQRPKIVRLLNFFVLFLSAVTIDLVTLS
jgi:hypothetical protein